MSITEPKSLKQIHDIREQIYKETKDMSIKERIVYTKKIAGKFLKGTGLKSKKVER